MAYENLLKRTISSPDKNIADESTWQDMVVPIFGNDSLKFQENVSLPVKRVMVGLDQVLGVIEYSPVLPQLCEILLSHMSESYAFCALREMAHAPNWYFPTYGREYAAWANAFMDILERLHPTTASFYKKHGVWNVAGVAPVFRDFFTTLLPQKYVLRIMDIYTLEGSKVIFRFGVALLVIFKMEQHTAGKNRNGKSNGSNTSEEKESTLFGNRSMPENIASNDEDDDTSLEDEFNVWEALKIWTHDERFNFEYLVKKAYGVHGTRRPRRFPRRNILARIVKMEEERLLNDSSLDTGEMAPSRPLALTEPFVHPEFDRDELGSYTKKPPEPVLAEPTQNRILLASWLPLSLRMTKLQLLFSTNVHGRTLEMFYNRVANFKHTVLLAEVFTNNSDQSDKKTIIGWYASQAWRVSPQVYGDGECILFRLSPNPKHWKWHPRNKEAIQMEEESESNSKENNATALLEQFQVSTLNYISMGGNKDGGAALRFNEDFTRAESAPAEGFDNEPLAGQEGYLDIGLVEVYGLVRQET